MQQHSEVVIANHSSGVIVARDDDGACAVLELIKGDMPRIGGHLDGNVNSIGVEDLLLDRTATLSVFVHAYDCSLEAVREEVG